MTIRACRIIYHLEFDKPEKIQHFMFEMPYRSSDRPAAFVILV